MLTTELKDPRQDHGPAIRVENLVKRYVIVGNEAQIIRELSAPKPIASSTTRPTSVAKLIPPIDVAVPDTIPINGGKGNGSAADSPSLLEIGRRAALLAEREAIERVLTQTRWNRRQAAKILKVSYKALLNKLKAIEEQNTQNKNLPA